MILISKLPSGAILVQRDSDELLIDAAAIPQALPAVLLSLTESSKALGLARKAGYEDGLTVGHAAGVREARADYEREVEGLALLRVNATLAA